MELTEEKILPCRVQAFLRVLVVGVRQTRHSGGIFGFAHENLALTITLLDGSVGRVCPTVELGIQLPSPIWESGSAQSLLSNAFEEFREAASHSDKRDLATRVLPFADGSGPAQLLEHGWCGAATTIAVPEEEQCLGGNFEVLVTSHPTSNVRHVTLRVVVVDRGHVGQDLTRVDADPVEGRVREVVRIVPRQLLRKEAGASRQTSDLRELR